jgi:hypothetical protein
MHPIHNHNLLVHETANRRKIFSELAEINALHLRHAAFTDHMSRAIRQWTVDFLFALRARDENEVAPIYREMMQELLRDALTQTPLDENAILGSDGETYSSLSYAIYTQHAPEQLRQRSPLHPEQEGFTVQPHPIARHMVRWLQSQPDALLALAQHELYQRIAERIPQDAPHDPLDELFGAVEERARRDRQEIHERMDRLEEGVEHVRIERVENPIEQAGLNIQQLEAIARMRNQLRRGQVGREERRQQFRQRLNQIEDQNRVEMLRQLDEQNERIAEAEENVRERMDNLDAADCQREAAVRNQLLKLQEEIRAHRKTVRKLESYVERNREKIKEAEREDAEIAIRIQKLKNRVRKRNAFSMGRLLTTLALVGSCGLATLGLQSACVASGWGAAVTPLARGAKITLFKPL